MFWAIIIIAQFSGKYIGFKVLGPLSFSPSVWSEAFESLAANARGHIVEEFSPSRMNTSMPMSIDRGTVQK